MGVLWLRAKAQLRGRALASLLLVHGSGDFEIPSPDG